MDLATITLKAKVDTTVDIQPTFGLIVNNKLDEKDALNATEPPAPDDRITGLQIAATDKNGAAIVDQTDHEVSKAVDGDDTTQWHTYWNNNPDYEAKKVQFPADIVITMDKTYKLNKLTYVPRTDKGGGTIKKGTISYSNNNQDWTQVSPVAWEIDGQPKEYTFNPNVSAKYVKLSVPVDGANGGFLSAQEFKLYGEDSTTAEEEFKNAVDAADAIAKEPNATVNQMLKGIKDLSDAIKNYNK